MSDRHTTGTLVVCTLLGMLVTGLLTFAAASKFYEVQLDRLAANPLCAAACNVLKAARK